MAKITLGFASMEKAHAVSNEVRKSGFHTINTQDSLGFYVNVITGDENRDKVYAARQTALASLK